MNPWSVRALLERDVLGAEEVVGRQGLRAVVQQPLRIVLRRHLAGRRQAKGRRQSRGLRHRPRPRLLHSKCVDRRQRPAQTKAPACRGTSRARRASGAGTWGTGSSGGRVHQRAFPPTTRPTHTQTRTQTRMQTRARSTAHTARDGSNCRYSRKKRGGGRLCPPGPRRAVGLARVLGRLLALVVRHGRQVAEQVTQPHLAPQPLLRRGRHLVALQLLRHVLLDLEYLGQTQSDTCRSAARRGRRRERGRQQ